MQQRESVEHLLYECTKLQTERKKLVQSISNQNKWPVNKSDLANKHIKHFTQFVNSIDFVRDYDLTRHPNNRKNDIILTEVIIYLQQTGTCTTTE